MKKIPPYKNYKWLIFLFILSLIILYFAIPPDISCKSGYSQIIFDRSGNLLRATLASDQQYRFPPLRDSLPQKYRIAVIEFEDRRFMYHPGVDPLSIIKAVFTNTISGKQKRGGSTITMQLVRLLKPRSRTYYAKLCETLSALKLSLHKSKEDILKHYCANVPMGGNTIGIETASYRYLGKPPDRFTWAEAALFAVLPNNPSMINLSSQRPNLLRKRNQLLMRLNRRGHLDSLSCVYAMEEPLPDGLFRIPFKAPHFTNAILQQSSESLINTTLDPQVQMSVQKAISTTHNQLHIYGIHNIAAIAVETATGEVRGYAGSQSFSDSLHFGQVDGVRAKRSTGSLLKPFLAICALDRGPYTMHTIIRDVPTFYGTFSPYNADMEFSGLVTLEEMLVKSLNVPAVRLLHYYGVEDFYHFLQRGGVRNLFRSPEGYGLSLILGGAEASLWDLTQLFCTLGNLGSMQHISGIGVSNSRDGVRLFSEASAWLVLNALAKLKRPGSQYYWQHFSNQVPVAWKTGTSYGQKDGWAIGVNSQWVIGVWVGNFNGLGNPALGGAQSAGPLLLSLFNTLSDQSKPLWFEKPEYDLKRTIVCKFSGFTASSYCSDTMIVSAPLCASRTQICQFHTHVCVSKSSGYAVCSKCWILSDTAWKSLTRFDPSVAAIMRKRGREVNVTPRHNPDCTAIQVEKTVQIEYPVTGVAVRIPRNFQGEFEKAVFKAYSLSNDGPLYWYLDGEFLGETEERHTFAVALTPGEHKLVVQHRDGARESAWFKSY